jgi:CrcB protein
MQSADPRDGELSPGDDSSPTRTATHPAAGAKPTMPPMISIAVISVGAALGALLRWYLSQGLNSRFADLPPGTLAANIIGAYLIGIGMAVFLAYPNLSPQWRLFTITGFLGGLTTFSSFSAEVTTALLAGHDGLAVLTVLAHVLGSIVMTLLGIGTVRALRRGR